MKRMAFAIVGIVVMASALAGGLSGDFKDPYYKERPQFHFYPAADTPRLKIDRIGPIGIGLELRQPAFTMHIISVEKGSPAAASGKLKKGQIIESINGKVLRDIDPRIILGNLITDAEAKDGILKMMVKDKADAPAQEVIVTLPVMGSYSDTWPLDCEKSDTIVRNFADFLAKHPRGWGSALFLLSTGEDKDLDVVRKWFSGKLSGGGGHPWDNGYTGPAICEYYLRTGDESVLPAIKSRTEKLKKTIYNGSWMGRGGCNYNYMAGGHMNAAGVHCLTFLLMAKECGVDVDEHTLQSCLYHFFRYAGHFNVSYGDGLPEGGGVDNGKNGGLAFAMAAAASLSADGENSIYAKARDINANKSFYTTSWLFHGHTGGGVGEIWRGAAAGLLAKKRPNMYRSFMNERRWMYELARTHDGAFGWASGINVSYGTTGHKGGRSWGNYVPLIYTIPRQKLIIYGAPRTKYCKTHTIPKRPWGTEADSAFYSLEPGEYKPGKKQDMTEERLPTHASWPLLQRTRDPKISDDDLLMFANHPDCIGRGSAAGGIKNLGRHHLVLGLLKSKDPRARLAGLQTFATGRKSPAPPPELTDEMITVIGGMISGPEESWWVVMEAMKVIKRAPAEKIAPHVDSLVKWMQHEDWWLRQAALHAVTPLAAHKDYYQKILPVIGDMVRTNTRAVGLNPLGGVIATLQTADPEIQALAVQELGQAYKKYPATFTAPGGQNMSACVEYMIKGIARNLANTPGGFDKLYAASKERYPNQVLPHKDLYMGADPKTFGPVVQKAFKPIVVDQLIPRYLGYGDYRGSNAEALLAEAASTKPKSKMRGPVMDGLVALYNRIGVADYNWQTFGPDFTAIKWDYHSYDPAETKLWEKGFRYRKVSPPKGMEGWNKTAFDAKAGGWKKGNAPFGQFGGKLVTEPGTCKQPFCRCGEPMKTFWDKEVLLLRTKLKFPEFKEGHRYRLVVGGMSHVQGGDGFEIYVNGKTMFKRGNGVGKRQGGKPVCHYIDKAWWPVFKDEVTIAAKAFLPIPGGKRSPGVKKNHFSVWIQEMKCPPIPPDDVEKGKLLQPMLCTEWQKSRDKKDRFLFDGTFATNDKVLGSWVRVVHVADMAAFTGTVDEKAKQIKGPRNMVSPAKLNLMKDGMTDSQSLRWTGDTLMDLKAYQALKMVVRTVAGKEYLFIQSGGFSNRNKEDWKSGYTVMKRAE